MIYSFISIIFSYFNGFTILQVTEHYSQMNVPILKTKHFR